MNASNTPPESVALRRSDRRQAPAHVLRPEDDGDALALVRADAKLPVGRVPPAGSPDWAHRCQVRPAQLTPMTGPQFAFHEAGMPRPRTADGWPMPYASSDARDPCVTDLRYEYAALRRRRCQVCGISIAAGSAVAVLRFGHSYQPRHAEQAVPWVEGRAALHARCLRFSVRYCPELLRQLWQGVASFAREPATGRYHVLDGVMLDARDYLPVVVPVWHLEVLRDSGQGSPTTRRLLSDAMATNTRTAVVFGPRTARTSDGEQR